jgi:hypothetical protein
MLCCEAKQRKKPQLVERLLRSRKRLAKEDRNHIADFYTKKGRFAPKGRRSDPATADFLERSAKNVRRLKANNPGLSHDRAIDEIAKLAVGDDDWTIFAAKLANYVRRSPRRKKLAQ